MQLVERHIININHQFYKEIDRLSFQSKNLYNYANYIIRQHYFTYLKENNINSTSKYLKYPELFHLVKTSEPYKALPAKVSNSILQVLDKNWKSFVSSISDYYKNKSKYKALPSIPRYKHKEKGRNVLVYDKQALNKKYLDKGLILLSKTNIKVNTKIPFENIKQIRIIPKNISYVIEVVYDKILDVENTNYKYSSNFLKYENKIINDKKEVKSNENKTLAIDLGVNNICAVVTNIKNQKPLLINGRHLKSINQFYNKKKAELSSQLPKGIYTSKRIKKLTDKRNNAIHTQLHMISRFIVDYVYKLSISKVIFGYNKDWKTDINIGKKNNQNFVNIPYLKLVEMVRYKLKMLPETMKLELILNEESYTSKCSFVDGEYPKKNVDSEGKDNYVGKRIKRGLFRTKNGIKINADINGAYNILVKGINVLENKKQPSERSLSFCYVAEDVSVHPYKINIL